MKKNKTYFLITAGRGPAECCWVVTQLARKLMTTEFLNIKIKMSDVQKGPKAGTAYSILLEIKGEQVKEKMKTWLGTIQWIGQSLFRPQHKRKNWFVGTNLLQLILPERLRMEDLEFKTFRASGPGGQHRNKVETAVQVKHKATRITASSSEHRSQHRNKQAALAKLSEQFEQQFLAQQKQILEQQWKQHLQIERGNATKVFVGKKFIEG